MCLLCCIYTSSLHHWVGRILLLGGWRHVLAIFEKAEVCSPFIEKCANLLRTHSLISFAKVSVGGIRLSKASFFEWSDTRKYSTYHFRGSSFMYTSCCKPHVLNGAIQGSTFTSAEAVLCTLLCQQGSILKWHSFKIPSSSQGWNYSLLPTSALLSRPLMSAVLMFFSFYNIKILQLFKMKLMLSHHMVFNFIVSTEWTILA